ncbi:MAG: hypothetical protein ACF8TS_15540 [Maioricimonas sp. JB049]
MSASFTSPADDSSTHSPASARYRLWVDGVGTWMVLTGQEFVIGAAGPGRDDQDVSLMAGISRKHLTVIRSGESWLIDAVGRTSLDGRAVDGMASLREGSRIELHPGVQLQFQQPNPLSGTAVLGFLSGHRPPQRVDGIVLVEQVCLLGPADDHHIRCPFASSWAALFQRGSTLWCKSRKGVSVDEGQKEPMQPLQDGSIVETADIRFRVEILPRPGNETT